MDVETTLCTSWAIHIAASLIYGCNIKNSNSFQDFPKLIVSLNAGFTIIFNMWYIFC